jgi:hypothetical protein
MESYSKNGRGIILRVSLAFIFGALLIGLLGTTLSLVQTSRTVSSVGSVKGIGVGIYWNSACTNRTSSINWGLLEPGSNKTVAIYVRNEGNAVTTLSKAAQNWNPSAAPSYMTLNWNYAGQTLSVNQVLQVKLTLVVLPSIAGITSFSFDITITATG